MPPEELRLVCGFCWKELYSPEAMETHVLLHKKKPMERRFDPEKVRSHLDLRKKPMMPKGAKYQPAVCLDCGNKDLQPVAEGYPLDDGRSCLNCGSKRMVARVPTADESTFLSKVPPGFMRNHVSVVIQTKEKERRLKFGRPEPALGEAVRPRP